MNCSHYYNGSLSGVERCWKVVLIVCAFFPISYLDEGVIAGPSGVFVRHEGQMRVQFLTEGADDGGLVELVVGEELEGLAVEGDVDLADGVVGRGLRVPLGDTSLQPGVQQTQTVAALHLLYEFGDGTQLPHHVEEVPHELL